TDTAPPDLTPLSLHDALPISFTQVFGEWLCDMARVEPKLVGITPAMREGSGLVRFAEEFPERYFDVGIAEQHAVTFAAGLACERSEEHTSELQSLTNLVCRLL